MRLCAIKSQPLINLLLVSLLVAGVSLFFYFTRKPARIDFPPEFIPYIEPKPDQTLSAKDFRWIEIGFCPLEANAIPFTDNYDDFRSQLVEMQRNIVITLDQTPLNVSEIEFVFIDGVEFANPSDECVGIMWVGEVDQGDHFVTFEFLDVEGVRVRYEWMFTIIE